MTMEYFDWALKQAETRPNKIAITDLDTNTALTYLELEQRSSALAGYLQNIGIVKRERVAILSRNCPHFFELEFAC
ncbi:MAG: acyl--CoA ligase, partial [Gammaproteobacteria bacterium]|nr:acyl--CoA ligase [Gammaproteobacteria bacterium]